MSIPESIKPRSFESLPETIQDRIKAANEEIGKASSDPENVVKMATEKFSEIFRNMQILGIRNKEMRIEVQDVRHLTEKQLASIHKPNSSECALSKEKINEIVDNVHGEFTVPIRMHKDTIETTSSQNERIEKKKNDVREQCLILRTKYLNGEKALNTMKNDVLTDISKLPTTIEDFQDKQEEMKATLVKYLATLAEYPGTADEIAEFEKSTIIGGDQSAFNREIINDDTLEYIQKNKHDLLGEPMTKKILNAAKDAKDPISGSKPNKNPVLLRIVKGDITKREPAQKLMLSHLDPKFLPAIRGYEVHNTTVSKDNWDEIRQNIQMGKQQLISPEPQKPNK